MLLRITNNLKLQISLLLGHPRDEYLWLEQTSNLIAVDRMQITEYFQINIGYMHLQYHYAKKVTN